MITISEAREKGVFHFDFYNKDRGAGDEMKKIGNVVDFFYFTESHLREMLKFLKKYKKGSTAHENLA